MWSAVLAIAAVTAWAHAPAMAKNPAAAAKDATTPATEPLIAILCYHDLSDAPGRDAQTVSPQFLRQQIRACRQAGWTFMSLSELMAARTRPEQLPARVMVLTFDDAYRSFYEHALPILRAEGIRATLGVVTSFIDKPPAGMPPLMTWDQIREADRSGWVEIASHSHDLHRYEMSNPHRDTAPSAATRRYLAAAARYEDREEYRSRIRADLLETQRVLRDKLGHGVSTLVWPYGMHTEMARSLAAQAGFTSTLALGSRPATLADLAGGSVPRILVTKHLRIGADPRAWIQAPQGAIRAARVRLGDLWDGDLAAYRARLDATIVRLRAIGATHVFMDATARDHDNGYIRHTFFPGHQAPMRVDLWSMAASKLSNAGMRVWARVPSMNLTWVWEQHPEWRLGQVTTVSRRPRHRAWTHPKRAWRRSGRRGSRRNCRARAAPRSTSTPISPSICRSTASCSRTTRASFPARHSPRIPTQAWAPEPRPSMGCCANSKPRSAHGVPNAGSAA